MTSAVWYVDSSVILRAIVNGSTAARTWCSAAVKQGDAFYGSRMVELEVRRVVHNTGHTQREADAYLDLFHLISITDDLIDDAIALPYPLGGADALHIATALKLQTLAPTLATHDAQMAHAAQAISFPVTDPVTDDNRRPPVA